LVEGALDTADLVVDSGITMYRDIQAIAIIVDYVINVSLQEKGVGCHTPVEFVLTAQSHNTLDFPVDQRFAESGEMHFGFDKKRGHLVKEFAHERQVHCLLVSGSGFGEWTHDAVVIAALGRVDDYAGQA
jgi:hypothetical protein